MNTDALLTLLNTSYWNNTLQAYLMATLILVATVIFGVLLRFLLKSRLRQWALRTVTTFDDTIVKLVESISGPLLLVTGVYLGSQVLMLPDILERILWGVFLTALVIAGVQTVQRLIEFFFRQRLQETQVAGSRSAVYGLVTVVKYALWVVGFLLIASNLGMNVTSLIAGLGVGGVAVAFALQNILEDLFSSFALYFDRPFEVGDFIVIGDQSGTVQRIGIKTTRIQALQGEEIVISNRELTTAQVQNFKRLEERRIELQFGVTYETSAKNREAIPQMVEEIISGIEGVRFGRVHLDELADSALVYTVVYHVEDADFTVHMDKKQELLFTLLTTFSQKKIDLAYPTQTVWVKK